MPLGVSSKGRLVWRVLGFTKEVEKGLISPFCYGCYRLQSVAVYPKINKCMESDFVQ